MFSKITVYARLLRVSNWIKNLFLFVPWLFAKQMFFKESSLEIVTAFFSFCFISSFVYIINDLFDLENDRYHPVKKSRPLVTGEVGIREAAILIIITAAASLLLAFQLNGRFILIIAAYAGLNFFYSIKLKDIVIIDIFTIAAGFVLRIAAGAVAIDVVISKWLLLTTLFISLFLAVMKRRGELTAHPGNGKSRKVLSEYTTQMIDQISMVASAGVIICYALYTVADQTIARFRTERLIYTTAFVVYGIFRYTYLTHKKQNTENVAEVIIKDIPMLINLLLYIITVTIIIYFN